MTKYTIHTEDDTLVGLFDSSHEAYEYLLSVDFEDIHGAGRVLTIETSVGL